MSEPSQETFPSAEAEVTKRPRKRFTSETPRKKSGTTEQAGPKLLCDSWNIPNKQRLLIGFVGLAFVVPYSALSLTYPEWSGHIGGRLSLALFSAFGQGALAVPALLAYLTLSCAGLRTLRKTRYLFALPLFAGFVILLQRAAQSGGWLGRFIDGLVSAAVGPGGAWLFTGTGLVLLTLGFFPKAWTEFIHHFSLLGEHIRERRLRLASWWNGLSESREACKLAKAEEKEKAQQVALEAETQKQPEFPEPAPQIILPPAPPAPAPRPVPPPAVVVNDATLEDVPVPRAPMAPLQQEPPKPTLTPLATSGNKAIFADPEEIEESLELHPEPLTGSSEKQAAVPRARAFELPSIALLDDIPASARMTPSEDKSQALLDALDAFGVKAKLLQIVRGPAVTRYELQPARGVKVSKFTSLTKDIALALASATVRIEAPIPGKSAVGIEIANKHTDLVVLKDILRDTMFTDSKGLTVALGKDLSGRPVVTDLQKMPHLLVAGTTGSGKSVCVNGLIISLLYRFTPDQLQLMMVDPKQVELSVYEDIPHLVGFSEGGKGEIIVDPKKAAQALHQVVELMEARYTMFAENKVRNLAEYNEKCEEPLPWFVVIIDELADLMMVASKSVETSICRIAQKARAAGIHLVLATQRPSADVITGLIKVNIPSRAAFAVSSQVDSRVILDSGGAEHLLGKGDMLFLPVDASDPRRVQGSYVGNDEIARVVEFWKGQGIPDNRIEFDYKPDLLTLDEEEQEVDADDALLEEALRVILNRQQASASMLQTELKVGYARARRLIMAMEKKGWVGPPEGSKPRKITYSGGTPDSAPEATE